MLLCVCWLDAAKLLNTKKKNTNHQRQKWLEMKIEEVGDSRRAEEPLQKEECDSDILQMEQSQCFWL